MMKGFFGGASPTHSAPDWARQPIPQPRHDPDGPARRAEALKIAVMSGCQGDEAIRMAGLFAHYIKTGDPLVRS